MAKSKKSQSTSLPRRVSRHVKYAIVPHKANAYHPHLIRKGGLVAVLSTVIIIQFVAGLPQFNSQPRLVLGAEASLSQAELLHESNMARLASDVPQLKPNDKLNTAATLKARDMIEHQYWSHDSPDGTTPWFWYREVNYRYDYAGENLAKGFQTPDAVVTAWMNSEEHKKNMLSKDYQDVGFGIVEGELNGEQTKLVVALYASPLGAPIQGAGKVLASHDGQISPIARFGIGLQSLTPTALGSIALLAVTLLVGISAHAYRGHLPMAVKNSWRRHHGLYTSLGMAGLILLLITLYGGGQIL